MTTPPEDENLGGGAEATATEEAPGDDAHAPQPSSKASKRTPTRKSERLVLPVRIVDAVEVDQDEEADPDLIEGHDRLKVALHGDRPGSESRPIYWNGVNRTDATLRSIQKALDDAKPPARPTSDEPPERS
jgi:hypothetical protein